MNEYALDDIAKDMFYNGLDLVEIAHYMNMSEEDVRELISELE